MCLACPRPLPGSCLLLALLLVVFHSIQLTGQVIRGSLVDTTANTPVQGATVEMLDRSGQTVATDVSSENGTFLVAAPRWGTFVISVRRVGYQPLVLPPVEVTPGDTLDLVYHLRPLAYEMEPFVVEAEALALLAHIRYLHREGFYRRQSHSYDGRFLDPTAIERRRDFAKRADDFLIGQAYVTHLSSSQLGYRLRCGRPRLFIDDRLFIGDELDQAIDPADVLAMEIYDGSYMYNAMYGPCSVVVWTNRRAEAEHQRD